MISAIVSFIRSRLYPDQSLIPPLPCEDVPVPRVREHGGPYRSAESEPFYSREAKDWDIVSIHGHYTVIVYTWDGCRGPIDYRSRCSNESVTECECEPTSTMISSCLVDVTGDRMDESETIARYGNACDGTIIQTMSGTVYRLCGKRGNHESWSSGSIFREGSNG